MSVPRTLIIGLDGATFNLIDPLIEAGCLPTLRKIIAQGVRGSLRAWPNLNSAASWSSIVTGFNPGQHGIFDFGSERETLLQRGVQWRPHTAANRRKDPFWRVLSAAGQRVGVVNVPISYPADRINGFMLAGMDTPSVHSLGFAHPPELYTELRRQGIDYVIDAPKLGAWRQREPQRLPVQVHRMVEARARAILYLMQTRSWDTLMGVFVALDRVQHYYWQAEPIDVGDPGWTPVRLLYQQIDAFLADALARLDANTTILLVSDHGFSHARAAPFCLNPLFARLGLLSYQRGTSDWQGRVLQAVLHQGRRFIPYRLQFPLAKTFPRLHLRAVTARKFSWIDWAQTQVFANAYDGQVLINLQDRDLKGIVAPRDYDSLRDRVSNILLNLVDPVSGRRVVKGVYRREELYHGSYFDHAPDLVIDWDFSALGDSLTWSGGNESLTIELSPKAAQEERLGGMHHPEGILVACGPHIKRGARLINACIYDIAPTILYLQGQPIPVDMDGKVLTDLFVEEHLQRAPIQRGRSTTTDPPTQTTDLDANDALVVEQRLRDLGYIE